MMTTGTARSGLLAAALAGALCCGPALAQSGKPAAAPSSTTGPNAVQGFSKNRDKPVQIEATTLEVRDKQRIATFTGNVHVVQGDTTMRCKVLVVLHEDGASRRNDIEAIRLAWKRASGHESVLWARKAVEVSF